MDKTLVALWRSAPDFLADKSCAQVVGFAGEGRLLDGSSASIQFRDFLAQIPGHQLSVYAKECLSERFDNAPYALQDIVNEIGSRIGFEAEPGRYRGVRNEVGFDGVWRSSDGFALLVEVKTTDAYRINLDTIAGYREALIADSRIKDTNSSLLLAVGRQDTGDLEAQIRGSRHAWDIRVISVDALLELMAMKEQMSDWGTSSQINTLLRPMEYTRVDGIVRLLFATAEDVKELEVPNEDLQEAGEAAETSENPPQPFDHECARNVALERVEEHLGHALRKKGRVFWSSADASVSLICLSSRPYKQASADGFWYGFKPGQKKFLDEAANAYVLFVCGHELPPLLIDRDSFLEILSQLKTTPPTPSPEAPLQHWHVFIYTDGVRAEVNTPLEGCRTDVSKFLLK